MNFSIFKKAIAVAQIDIRQEKNKYRWILYLLLYGLSIFGIIKGIEFYTQINISFNVYIGIVYYFVFSSGLIFGSELITDWRGTVKVLLAAPISPLSILLGKTIFVLKSSLRFHYLLFIFLMVLTSKISMLLIIRGIIGVIFHALTGVGIGLLLSTFGNQETSKTIISFFNFLIIFFGGFFIQVNMFPFLLQPIISLFPLLHVNRLLIYGELNAITISMTLLWFTLSIFGSYQFNKNIRK